MAWDIIPDTRKKCQNAVKKCNMSTDVAKEVMRLWDHLHALYPSEVDPLAFSADETGGKKQVKIIRIIQKQGYTKGAKGEKEISDQAHLEALKVYWGDGSRKGRGKGNQGNKFEDHLVQAINKWATEGESAITDSPEKSFVLQMATIYDDTYKWWDNRKLIAKNMGGNDTKRPLKLKNGTWFVGSAGGGGGYDIGEKISDVTVTGDKGALTYISAKTSGTTALVNLGVRTNYFPIKDIKENNIKLADGKKLLQTFGIDEAKFCKVFNDADAGIPYNEITTPSTNFDSTLLKALIKGSLGYGFHYVHIDKGKIFHMKMTEQFLNNSCIPSKSSIKIQYGGTGKTGDAKRINIIMTTNTLNLTFSIRNTSGKSTKDDPNATFPTHLQAGYRFNGETKDTFFWEAADDSYSGRTDGVNDLDG